MGGLHGRYPPPLEPNRPMPFRTYSRESEIIGHALGWGLKAWLLLVLGLLVLAVARSAWQVQYGWTWGVVLRRNLAIAGVAAAVIPAAVLAALMVLVVVLQSGFGEEREQASPWLAPVCSDAAGARGPDFERLLVALQTPRPPGLRAPSRRSLLEALEDCLGKQDPAALRPDRASLERLQQVLWPGAADPYKWEEAQLQRQASGALHWLLLAPDLRAAVRACTETSCAAAAIRAAASWCERQPEPCRDRLSPQDLDWMVQWARARWPGWAVESMPALQEIRRRLEV